MRNPPLPPLNASMLLRALCKRPGGQPACAPEVRTGYMLDQIDLAQLRAYNAALGFAHDALPVTFYYLIAQRAQLATMLDPAFPFRIPGMIHLSNDLAEQRRADPLQPLAVDTRAQAMAPAPDGAVHVLIETVARQDGQPVFTCSSEYLAVRGQRTGKAKRAAEPLAPLPAIASWQLDTASGRRYAAISGDWNPIHLWRWSARLMGMKTPIIHGMHTVARACAALEAHAGRRIVSISARFKAPVALPGATALSADTHAGRFIVDSHARSAVVGDFAFEVAPRLPATLDEACTSR